MCHTCLKEVSEAVKEKASASRTSKTWSSQLKADPTFKALISELEGQNNRMSGFGPHPKMSALKMLMLQHFGERITDGDEGGETRAMVFVHNRGAVDEVVQWLNEESPILKATKFVGQSTDKQGQKGFGQKQQQEVCIPYFTFFFCFV